MKLSVATDRRLGCFKRTKAHHAAHTHCARPGSGSVPLSVHVGRLVGDKSLPARSVDFALQPTSLQVCVRAPHRRLQGSLAAEDMSVDVLGCGGALLRRCTRLECTPHLILTSWAREQICSSELAHDDPPGTHPALNHTIYLVQHAHAHVLRARSGRHRPIHPRNRLSAPSSFSSGTMSTLIFSPHLAADRGLARALGLWGGDCRGRGSLLVY
jgi:hypothetical protein